MPPLSGAAMDAARRAAGALLPRFDFVAPVTSVIQPSTVRRISPDATAFRGCLEFIKGRTDALMVMHGEVMVGILTEADMLKLPLETGKVRKTLVSELMTPAEAIRMQGHTLSNHETGEILAYPKARARARARLNHARRASIKALTARRFGRFFSWAMPSTRSRPICSRTTAATTTSAATIAW